MTELTNADAHNITRRAQATAERLQRSTEDTATRLRERHQQHLRELHARRQAMENRHTDLMRSARDQVQRADRMAAEHRHELRLALSGPSGRWHGVQQAQGGATTCSAQRVAGPVSRRPP
jgi:hypothetical protein